MEMTGTRESTTTRLKQDASTTLPPDHNLRRRRRRSHLRCLAWTCCVPLVLLALLFLVALVLALTVFKPREPTTTLVSATVAGVAPRVTFPVVRVEINVTLDLDILVDNPNRVAFSHAAGRSELYYRGTQVGDADVAPGRIPSRGTGHLYSRLTLEADRLAADLGSLVADVLAGRLELDSSTRIPGRVVFLGFIKRHVVAVSDCHFVVGFPSLRVLDQQCRREMKL